MDPRGLCPALNSLLSQIFTQQVDINKVGNGSEREHEGCAHVGPDHGPF